MATNPKRTSIRSIRSTPQTPSTRTTNNSAVLASLRATQLVANTPSSTSNATSKSVLPAELINMILEHLGVRDLFAFARTARRMQEMVFDDTRWVQRLKSMGVWDEGEARRRAEDGLKRGAGAPVGKALPGGRRSMTLFDAGAEERKKSAEGDAKGKGSSDAGFDRPKLVSGAVAPSGVAAKDPMAALKVMARVRSIRGFARQEFGKVYGALAPFYFDIARSQSHSDPVLFRTYREPEQQAQMLSQLRRFVKADYSQGWDLREQKLENIMGIFENAVLREFEQGMNSGDAEGRMKRYATVLVILNGGSSGIDMFIQNNPVMLHKDELGHPSECIRTAFDGHINLAPSETFFSQLAARMNEQIEIIDKVFPQTIDVLSPFLERIADEVVSEYITTLFDEAHEQNIESYLKAVPGLFQQALRFAISLKPSKATKTEFKDFSKGIISKTFEQHIDLYLHEELDFFNKKSLREVESWEQRLQEQEASQESFFYSNVSRQAAKQDFLSSFRKMVMMPINATSTLVTGGGTKKTILTNSSSATPNRSSTPVPFELSGTTISQPQDAPTSELAAKAAVMNSRLEGIKSLFSIEVALDLVHAAKTSLERIATFVALGGQSGEEAREQCEAIFVSLLQLLGTRHIKTGFDKAVNHLAVYNPREIGPHGTTDGVQPLVTFLELVNVGDLIQQMVDVFYVQELVMPKLSDADDFVAPAVKEKKRFEQMLDERVAAGLNKGIDVLMDEVEYICATTQQPSDFNPLPGPDGQVVMMDIGPSETATQVVDVVRNHVNMLVGSTDKNVLDVFNQEVGVRLFTVLCKHLKRQRISVDGAIRLISDTNHYHAYIRSMKNKTLTEYFNAMRELSQIYLISPNDAKEIGTILADSDRYRGIFTAEEVYQFAERRADWFVVKKDVEKAMYGMGCVMM
ncbi:secretion pathway protein Sls2/Rcy1 [Microthyrium microscopicum]|uniref:Secretion pathway protein Sls2/Rcy1 n=1 Tax=Microthyrium microscopicum TaxID=703497 RepID=A0A6A6U4V7_9PEZI|nr:secretion pathway protein Sls2/Rcy1 [Microthyrium microscopicum]